MRPDAIYAKTASGQEEVQTRRAGLTARQRTLLIMLDGRKPLSDMLPLLPMEELAPALDALLGLGLIADPAAAATLAAKAAAQAAVQAAAETVAHAAAQAAADAAAAAVKAAADAARLAAAEAETAAKAPPKRAPRLAEAKTLMRQSAEKYLGLLAADLVRRIELAADESQVQHAIGMWHMAMRDSKYGREVAGPLLEETRNLLAA